jgi:hypothetical protein
MGRPSDTAYLGTLHLAYLVDHREQAKSMYCVPLEAAFVHNINITSSILREMTGSWTYIMQSSNYLFVDMT